VLGKSGKALSRKFPDNSDGLKKLQQVAKENTLMIPLAAKASKLSGSSNNSSSMADISFKGILNKVVKGDKSQVPSATGASKFQAANASSTRPVHFSTKLGVSFTMSRVINSNAATGQSFSAKLPSKKPVGILKNKTPGPIVGNQGSVKIVAQERPPSKTASAVSNDRQFSTPNNILISNHSSVANEKISEVQVTVGTAKKNSAPNTLTGATLSNTNSTDNNSSDSWHEFDTLKYSAVQGRNTAGKDLKRKNPEQLAGSLVIATAAAAFSGIPLSNDISYESNTSNPLLSNDRTKRIKLENDRNHN
jgi:hypothetical protein